MESSRIEKTYKKWMISMMAVILVLLVICTGLITVLLSQGEKSDSSPVGTDSLVRKPRGIRDMWNKVVVTIKETVQGIKAEFLADDDCLINDETDDETKAQPVCITKHCTETASTIISAMDKSADPCEDFYQFACGGYIKKNPVPKDKMFVSTSRSYESYYKLLLRILLEETDFTKEPNVVFKMQEAYHVCINTTYHSKEETEAFKRFVQNELDGWPKVDTNQSLEEVMGKLIRKGYDIPYIKLSLHPDSYNNPKNFVLHLDGNLKTLTTPISRKNGTEGELNALDKIGKAVGYNETIFRDEDKYSVMNLLQFLLLFASEVPEYMTIDKLVKITESRFDWLTFLNTAFDGIHTFTEKDHLFVAVDNVRPFLGGKNKGNSSFVQYIYDVIVEDVAKYGGPEISKHYYDMKAETEKNFKIPSSEDVCLEWIMESYSMVLTRLVVKQYLNPQTKQAATELVNLIIKAYEDTIKNSKWVDEVTKDRAIQKARSMLQQIAYPEYILDDALIEEEYSDLPDAYSTQIENYVAIKHLEGQSLKEITGQFDHHTIWLSTPLKINAGYSQQLNTIVMQLGMLILPYFDVDRVAAVNYGMVGFVIGHEIGHGFDTTGRLYDKIGRKTQWWTKSTEKKYLELAQCYIDQYSNYCPEELSADDICTSGEITVGENMADNSGLKAAYQAYLSYVKQHGEEKRLPGLQEFNPEQIFFLSFAYGWCENIPASNWEERYALDEHSAAKYRIIGSLSNSEDFARVFNCPPGPMNRDKDRCTLW